MTIQATNSDLKRAILAAAVEHHARRANRGRRRMLPSFSWLWLVRWSLGLLLLGLAGHLAGGRLVRRFKGPERIAERQAREGWRQLGVYLRDQKARSMVLVPLFSASHPTYGRRLSVLAEEARGGGTEAMVFWAIEEGGYDGEDGADHGAVIRRAYERHPAADLLVLLSVGELPVVKVARRGREIGSFGGRLVLVGELSGASGLLDQARRGELTLVARRTAWLNDRLTEGFPAGKCLAGEYMVVGG